MKKIFLFLLKKYSHTEEDRIKIHEILNDQVSNQYNEQTDVGNIYNSTIEFVMSNYIIRKYIEQNKVKDLKMIEEGLNESIKEAFKYIKNESKNG